MENPKNKNWNEYNDTVLKIVTNKANKLYKDKSFAEEHKIKYLLAQGLKYVCNLISFSTFTLALYLGLCFVIDWRFALALSIAGGSFYEWAKNDLFITTSKNVLKYKNWELVPLAFLIAIHFGSIGGSAFGAWQIGNLLPSAVIGAAELINIDSMNNEFNNNVAVLDKQIAILETKREEDWNSGVSQLALIAQKDTLIAMHKRAVFKAETKNVLLLAEYNNNVSELKQAAENKKQNSRISCLIISIAAELILLVCGCFVSFYLFREWVDANPEEWRNILKQRENKAETNKKQTRKTTKKQTAKTETKQEEQKQERVTIRAFKNETPGEAKNKTYFYNGEERSYSYLNNYIRIYTKRANEALGKGKTETYENNINKVEQIKDVLYGK